MTKESDGELCYCSACNLEFSGTIFDTCPVCLASADASQVRPWSRTEFLFKSFGDRSQPIIRMHADQKAINSRLLLVCVIVSLIVIVVGGLNAWADDKLSIGARAVILGLLFALVTGIISVIAFCMKNHRPVEILTDATLRIPRAMNASKSVTSRLLTAGLTATRDPSERHYYKLQPSQWLTFLEEMDKDESLSLVDRFDPMVGQFFKHVDSQLKEVRYAIRDAANRKAVE